MVDTTRRRFLDFGLTAAAISLVPAGLRGNSSSAGPLRLGLIGCTSGGIGLVRAALEVDPNVHLVAVADIQATNARRARTVFAHPLRRGGPHPRALVAANRVFDGLAAAAALCACPEIDAVILACSAGECPASLAAAVAAGRPTYVLGPGAVDIAGCQALESTMAQARRHGVPLAAGLFWRYDPTYLDLVAGVQAGRLGTLRRAEPVIGNAVQSATTDELLLTSHFRSIDLLNWIAEAEPQLVTVSDCASDAGGLRLVYPGQLSCVLRSALAGDTRLTSRHRLVGSAGSFDFQTPQAIATPAQRDSRRRSVQAFLAAVRGEYPLDTRPSAEPAALVAATRAAILGIDATRGVTAA